MRQGWDRYFFIVLLLPALVVAFDGRELASAQQSSGSRASTQKSSRISAVRVTGSGKSAVLRVSGAFDVPEYSLRARDGGRVVVMEVPGATLPKGGLRSQGETSLIERTVASTTARGVRLEIVLRRSVPYRATARPGNIEVRFSPERSRRSAHTNAEKKAGPTVLRRMYVERRDGRDRLILELSGPVSFRTPRDESAAPRLELRNTTIAGSISSELQGPDDSLIRKARVRQESDRVIVEVERAESAVGTAVRAGRRLVWMFTLPTGGTRRPRARTIAREADYSEEASETSEAAPFVSGVPMQIRSGRGRRRYSGRRIDLDFKDADIHNILRLVSEVGGVNVVTADDVSGTVTIRMRNVPWDQALDVILQAKGLGSVRRGNLIRVAPLEKLEKEREAAIARRKQQEQLAPLETRLVPVSYATANELSPRVGELLSERGSVSVDERTNVMIVRDIIDNLDNVEELVRTLDTQTPQVLIEARIVEATSQYTRDVGIQWGGDVTLSSTNGNPTGLVFPSNVGITGGNFEPGSADTRGLSPFQPTVQNPNFAVNLPAITGTGQGGAIGLTLGSVGGNVNLNVRLSAAEANGVVRIISSPRILTLDNREASIAQGTLIPFSQVSAQGVNTAFQEAKLELRVRPHVTSDGSVSMHVKITRDEPDFTRTSPRGDPTILKREAETDLLVTDGNTAVIGGIYTRNTGRNIDQVPFFGDIPVLGVLFQRRRVRDDRNELLIFLTPRIVNRAEALPE